MTPIFFNNPCEFRDWLEENHQAETELWVGYYKVASGKPSMTWSQSVDQALCFGWIDGIRKSVDKESYCIRFTPRKKTSKWSAINIAKVKDLTKRGLMQVSGREAFNHCKEVESGINSIENEPKTLPGEFDKIFKGNKAAWRFFTEQPPSYKKMIINWILSAKQEATRLRRLEKLISASEREERLYG